MVKSWVVTVSVVTATPVATTVVYRGCSAVTVKMPAPTVIE